MTAKPLQFSLHYDFRNPAPWHEPGERRFASLLEQIEWAERDLGYDAFSIPEHHFVDFASSPLTLAAAVAMRTRRAAIGTNVLVLPVHHPLRLAEDCLTVDAISGGRFRLGVGLGYRGAEHAALGTSLAERRDRAEEALGILRRAFAGKPFRHSGRFYSFEELSVTPEPVRSGGPEIWIGGLSAPGIERAARLGDGYLCASVEAMSAYVLARGRLGEPPGRALVMLSWLVDEDPERTFARVGEHLLYHYLQYREFGMDHIPAFKTPSELVSSGFVTLHDGPGAVAALRGIVAAGPVEAVELWAVAPGEGADDAAPRLDYFANHVMPEFRDADAQSAS
ncbi:MAG: LLM class flavin-dependent oxidoreductase [Myxococcales bacterium]|nr:LLM class flavin-dependent oxidoreductase [Myxococcales bacterium]